ncbi:MAG TPA: transcriptional regulator [Clostridiaceae bacterium]|nr:transcriptional regulator [Clostridiaceae bacterium]
MGKIYLDEQSLEQIVTLIEKQCGSQCEVVLHDLSKDYGETIIDIRNGHITGRKIGDCGSDFGLRVMRRDEADNDRFNYITHTRVGLILKSSSIYLRDEEGQVRYSICVNQNITETLRMEYYLRDFNNYTLSEEFKDDNHDNEILVNNVQDLLQELIAKGKQNIGKECNEMSKEDKLRLLDYLDQSGAFLITKSSDKVSKELGISKNTLYNYLEIVRSESNYTLNLMNKSR